MALIFVEHNSNGLLKDITFHDFIKFCMILQLKCGKSSYFIDFWVQVKYSY